MVRELKENIITNEITCDEEERLYENGLKSIFKKLDALIPQLGQVMLLVKHDNTDLNNYLITAYANCRELAEHLKLFEYDK